MGVFSKSISELKKNGNINGLINALDSGDINRKKEAAVALLNIDDPKAENAVTRILKKAFIGGDEKLVPTFIDMLIDQGNESIKVIDNLLEDNDSSVRAISIYMLGEIGNKKETERMVKYLGDPDEWVRVSTIDVLAKMHNISKNILLEALHDKNPKICEGAAEALSRIEGAEIDNILKNELKNEDKPISKPNLNKIRYPLTRGDRKMISPEQCIYCGGPPDRKVNLNLYKGDYHKILVDIYYCKKHYGDRIRDLILQSVICFSFFSVFLWIMFSTITAGNTFGRILITFIVGIIIMLIILLLGKTLLSKFFPSMKDSPYLLDSHNSSLGIKTSVHKGVLTITIKNTEMAKQFAYMNTIKAY
jgi:hypothetical protein